MAYKKACCDKIEFRDDIARKIIKLDLKLYNWLDKYEHKANSKKIFTGTVFATFKDVEDYKNYKKNFPTTIESRIWMYVAYYLGGRCFYRKKKNKLFKYDEKALEITVEEAPEPDDVLWENLQITNKNRRYRRLLIALLTLIILGLSFVALYGISRIQKSIKILNDKDAGDINKAPIYMVAAKYIVSFLFAAVTFLFNFLIKLAMIKLTDNERNKSNTKYLLSLSIKLSLFLFLNSGPSPVIVNYVSGNWDNKQILVNNSFFIFLSNSLFAPIIYLINPKGIINYIRRLLVKRNLDKDKNYYDDKTQGEMNK